MPGAAANHTTKHRRRLARRSNSIPTIPCCGRALESRTLVHIRIDNAATGCAQPLHCLRAAYRRTEGADRHPGSRAHAVPCADPRQPASFLLVLCNYYADGVQHAEVTRDTLQAFPDCPYAFALDYARLVHLYRDTQVESSLVRARVRYQRTQHDMVRTRAAHAPGARCAMAVS